MRTKLLSILMAMILLANLAACDYIVTPSNEADSQPSASGNTTSSTPAGNASGQSEATLEPFDRNATLDETVLVDEDGVKITATGLSYTNYSAVLALTIENNSGEDLSFVSGSLGYSCNSINGYMIDDGYLNCDVSNGKKANEVIEFGYDVLMPYGINEIADLEIGFNIMDDDYNSTYTGPCPLKTSAADTHDYGTDHYQQTIASSATTNTYGYEVAYFGQDAVYEQNGVKLLSSGVLRNKNGETALLLELENTTDSMVYVSSSDIKINGLVVSGSTWSSDAINPGKRRIVEVELSSVLDGEFWSAYGITEVGSVSLSLEQSDEEGVTIAEKTPITTVISGVSAAFDAEGKEVYNSNGLRIVLKTIQEDASDWSDDLYVLLTAENSSGKTLTIDDVYDSLSVNGFMTDYSFYNQKLADGESAALVIQLWESTLEDNQITSASDIQEIELKFEIKEGYTTLEEPVITITFDG